MLLVKNKSSKKQTLEQLHIYHLVKAKLNNNNCLLLANHKKCQKANPSIVAQWLICHLVKARLNNNNACYSQKNKGPLSPSAFYRYQGFQPF